MNDTQRVYLLRLLIGITLLLLWQYGSYLPVVGKFPLFDSFVVSKPTDIARSLWLLFVHQGFGVHVGLTLGATAAALVGGILSGMLLAFITYNFLTLRRILAPFVQFFNTLPRIVIAPYLLIAFGTGVVPRILMAASFIFFLVYFNVLFGLTRISQTQLRQVQMLGGNRFYEFLTLQLPIGFAWTIRAFPHAVAYGFVGTVFQEFVGGDSGVGSVMIYGLNELNAATVMATVVTLSALGWALFELGNWVGRSFTPWRKELGA